MLQLCPKYGRRKWWVSCQEDGIVEEGQQLRESTKPESDGIEKIGRTVGG
jgi:hypothetical protein